MPNTINQKEIDHFSKDAAHWWDENGPHKPLHRLNPTRIAYIKNQICSHFDITDTGLKPLSGLKIIDVGSGGGLVCEPMARMGADVTGADADPHAIAVATEHAAAHGLGITYINQPAEEITEQFDVVLALEIIEHIDTPQEFVKACAKLLKPGGLIIFSTLNRTPKSFALGIVAAEYILGWVPKGTHSWKKFLRPAELARFARNAGLKTHNIKGLIFNPLKNDFQMSDTDLDVNYFLSATNHPI